MPLVECWCMHMRHCPGRPSGLDHNNGGERRMKSNSILSHTTTNFIASRIHVNTTKLCNIMCTLVATSVILRTLECIPLTLRKLMFYIVSTLWKEI